MSWDADTIPLQKIKLWDDKTGIPYFSVKNEYWQPYFDTIFNLLGLRKVIKKSFIAEHMLFNSEIMRSLLTKIEEMEDDNWFITILKSINSENLNRSGFSEFETYGTYVMHHFPGSYKIKNIVAMRSGKEIFGENLCDEMMRWISKSYETISFEKWQHYSNKMTWHTKEWFRKLFSARFYVICYYVKMKCTGVTIHSVLKLVQRGFRKIWKVIRKK